jgi:methionyl-tRNA synthetase
VPAAGRFDPDDDAGRQVIEDTVREAGRLLSANETDRALKRIMACSNHFNQYFQKKKPWSDKDTAATTLYVAVNATRSLAIMLAPFIPSSCEKMWQQLNLGGSVHEQSWQGAADFAIPAGHQLGRVEPIFRKVEAKEIEEQKAELGGVTK